MLLSLIFRNISNSPETHLESLLDKDSLKLLSAKFNHIVFNSFLLIIFFIVKLEDVARNLEAVIRFYWWFPGNSLNLGD